MTTDASLVLHEPFSGISPAMDDSLSTAERSIMCRDILKQTLEIPYKLEVFQGELLHEVTKNKYWRDWDYVDVESSMSRSYESFDEYVEGELGFKRRKAYDLIDIYKTFVL